MAAFAVAYSRALRGLNAPPVRVEVHLANGLPSFMIVGLPEASVRESRERVRAALLQSGFDFPNRRITVNLAPADLPKDSARFDLPIAAGILAAAGQLPPPSLASVELIGELSLDGALRPVHAALTLAVGWLKDGSERSLLMPADSVDEACACGSVRLIGAATLREVCDHLRGLRPLEPRPIASASSDTPVREAHGPDLADVVGQALGRRALEIAATGNHPLLLSGPPGTGKSLLARRLAGLLPPLTASEALACATIGSATGRAPAALHRRPPMRSPHHSVSTAGLIGGGQPPRPGEISLAHQGVLFLDELPEFRRAAIEALREPLETGEITLARGAFSDTFPARFLLVAAMNPCPCGYLGDPHRSCRCTPDQVRRYRARVSGPLLDRFDLGVNLYREAAAVSLRSDAADRPPESSAAVALRVSAARVRRRARLEALGLPPTQDPAAPHSPESGPPAAEHPGPDGPIPSASRRLIMQAAQRFHWSMRGLQRTIRVARTIADLGASDAIEPDHVAEAIALRRALDSDGAMPTSVPRLEEPTATYG